MNYFSLIDEIKQVSLRYSEEFYEGDIYEYLNSGNHKYPCIILTVQNITTDEDVNTISATIFAVDRLTNDSSNKLEVQSLCMSKITQILGTLEERVSNIQSNTLTPFTEKFSDLCGGMYGEFTLEYIGDGVCDEGLQYKEIELTNNGIYDIIGYDRAIVNVVNREEIERLEQKIDELESTIDTVTSISITENGTYTAPEGVLGYNTIDVVTSASEVWEVPNGIKFGSSTFTSVPEYLDFSNVTNFGSMFSNCSNLRTIPLIDTSKGTSFNNMFNSCKITTIPQLDTSKGTDFSNMFYSCYYLTEIPQIDTSKGTNFNYMFSKCSILSTIPLLNTSNGNSFNYMFQSCTSLTSVTQIDVSKGTNFTNMFYSCSKLENITFVGSINYNIDFKPCTKLTYESVKSILTACTNTTRPTTSKTLYFSRTLTDQNGELAALIATCNSKKWTISGLTLQ